MADIDPNFTCSDAELSHTNITAEVWRIRSEGSLHENSILVVAIFQIVFVVLGTPWNAVVLASIIKNRHFKDATYILLMNLVIADLLVCLVVLPFNIYSGIAHEFTIGHSDYTRCLTCQGIVINTIALVFVSFFTLALMSVDRLIYLKQPLNYLHVITAKRVLMILPVVWIFCVIISTFPTFGFGEMKFANVLSLCSPIVVGETHLSANNNYLVFLCCVGIFPFATIILANIWVLIIACKHIHKKNMKIAMMTANSGLQFEHTNSDKEKGLTSKFHKQQLHLAQVFGAIFVANIITCVPTVIVAIGGIIAAENIPHILYAYVYLTYISQPVIHPVLETCLLGKGRGIIFKYLCWCKIQSRKSHAAQQTSL